MQPLPVSIVGKYQIVDLVGEGAMGNVYRAQDPVLNRSVAIKVMSDAIARDATLRDRFMREAQAAGSLQHPNVVTIFDFGEVDGHLFIAMEFVDGVDLEHLIETSEPLALDDRLGITIDVLLGLSYAHKRGIVHRDIKPANIRITEEGHAKIMDFGVAHLESAKMTATGMMVGTPNYMAPEQVTGQKISAATDIFAVGAVLYELLTRRKAFGADSLHSVLFKVVSEDPPALTVVAPELPHALDRVLRKALAKDSDQRYQSAQEMANDLTAIRATLSNGRATPALSLGATIARQTAERRAATPNDTRRGWTTGQLVGASVVLALSLVGITWSSVWRRSEGAAGRAPPVASAPVEGVNPDTRAAPSPKTAAIPPPPVSSSNPSSTSSTSSRTEVPRGNAAVADREAALMSVVRASAMKARAAAAGAGVPPAQLAVGDSHMADGDRLVGLKKYADAVAAMNLASASWAQLERTTPKGTTAASDRPAPDTLPPRSLPVNSAASPPPAPPPVVAPAGVVPATSEKKDPESRPVAVEIAAVVLDYARAIEGRDLAGIRAVYPTITAEQQRGFQQFFESTRGLRAVLTTGTPTVQANTATAQVTGTYEFTDASGKPQRQPVAFRATFRRDGNRWLIAAVR